MTVMTVLGPVEPEQLGRVDAHEHVFLRSPLLPGDEFQDPRLIAEEVGYVRDSGIDTVVDLTPIGLGRRPTATAQISRDASVHVVLATGIHRRAHYPSGHWLYDIDVDELANLMLTDLQIGIDDRDWQGPTPLPTGVRAGIIKLGAGYHTISGPERRWMAAGALAAAEARVPIAVHTEVGTVAHEVLDLLAAEGIEPHSVMLAHLDRNPDPGLHAELGSRGAFLGYDTIGRTKYHPDSTILDLIQAVVDRGKGGQILLGTDVGRSSMLRAYGGGPGMDVLGRTFLPRLVDVVGSDTERQLMVENPRRFLSS